MSGLTSYTRKNSKTVLDFGASGNGADDDAAAVQAALDWWVGGANRKLVFPAGLTAYRLASTVTADLGGNRGSSLIMETPITPDAGIGNALEIVNGSDLDLKLWVQNGGQTADYTQANPLGGDQAFLIRGIRGAVIDIVGYNYKGRVCRATLEGVGEPKTSRLHFKNFRTGDFGAANCGQSIYADASSAFGEFTAANWFWDQYGPVFENVADITFAALDSGWNQGNGMVLKGVLSFWANSLSLGDETGTTDLLTIEASAARSCANINIASLLLNYGKKGIVIKDIDIDGPTGTNAWTGVRVGYVNSNRNAEHGIYAENCQLVTFDKFESNKDAVSIELAGASNKNIDVNYNIVNAQKQAVIVGAGSYQCHFLGAIENANTTATPSTSAVEVNSTGRDIEFHSVSIESADVEYLYNLVANNNVVLTFGNLIANGSAAVMGPNAPRVARAVRGYRTRNGGLAKILSGASNVVISHGLAAAPTCIQLTGREPEVGDLRIDSIGAASFNVVNLGGVVASDQDIYWNAEFIQEQD